MTSGNAGERVDTSPLDTDKTSISVTIVDKARAAWPRLVHDAEAGPSDLELLTACRAGDPRAWELLVERYERLVFSVALRNGVTREEAADITQMTFIALLESIGKLREEQRVASWLMSVARRLAWRQRRRSERERLGLEGVSWPDDAISTWERVAVIQDGLQRLGRACRDLIQALYFDPAGPSYAAVAEQLGRPIGGIGPMRARCLQRLRSLLGEEADL
jgi:RNA polymerase sigma factor (sigma-70 family)